MLAPSQIFAHRKIDFEKLAAFGFVKADKNWIYSTKLPGLDFTLAVTIGGVEDGGAGTEADIVPVAEAAGTEAGAGAGSAEVSTLVTDDSTGEEYRLYLVKGATGAFVAQVREAVEEVILQIAEKCSTKEVFKSPQVQELISYINKKYGDPLEFLWEKFDNNAIVRRKESQKWYVLFVTLPKDKICTAVDTTSKKSVAPSKKTVLQNSAVTQAEPAAPQSTLCEIIDIHLPTEKITQLIDGKSFFPAYHMNKKHWITILLDGSVATEHLHELVDESYELAGK